MRISTKRLLAAVCTTVLLAVAAIVGISQPALATMQPSFRVVCYPQGMAPNDPIVFPGQAGKAHMHSFYGARGVDQNTTIDALLAQPTSQCGGHYDAVDKSAYWIPTLQRDGQAVYNPDGSQELRVYYQRAGGAGGVPVAQAFPQGLRIIAGDMHATTPQLNVSYVCAKVGDPGNQRGGTPEFLSCNADENLVAKLVFPDCWDGVNLDSADHKSHMAYSSGGNGACPADHPVKLPQITFEAWYYDVNGAAASSLAWSSGGAYSFHGDIMSAWDPATAANLVNQCINVAYDCNPLMFENIPRGDVTQAQVDAQLGGVPPVVNAPETGHEGMGDMPGMATPAATPTPTPTATPTPTPTGSGSTPEASEPVASGPTVGEPVHEGPTVRWHHGDLLSMWAVLRATLWSLLSRFGLPV